MASTGAIEAGRAFILVQLRDGLSPGFSAIRNKLQSFSREIDSYGRSIAKVGAVATSAFAAAIGSLVIPVKLAAGVETLRAEFEALTGSVKVTNQVIEELQRFAQVTPYSADGLSQVTKLLVNFGIEARQAVKDVELLSQVAGGSQEKLDRLGLAFAQIASKQRLMGTELLQLVEAGFNPLQTISESTGESMLSLSDRMSKGAISFDQVRSALVRVTGEGGRFNGLLEKMAATTAGQWQTLKEETAAAARALGEQLLPVVKDWLAYARDIIARVSDWIKNNKSLAGGIAALATGLGVFALAITSVTAALFGVSTAILVISGAMGVIGRLFGSTSKEMNTTARETREASTGVTTAVVAMSSTCDPLLMATKKLVSDLGYAFRRVGTAANSAMKKLGNTVAAGGVAVQAGVEGIIAAAGGLSAIGPTIDTATGLATAALQRMIATFQVASVELDVVIGEMLASAALLNGLGAISPLAGAAAEAAADAASIQKDLDETGKAQDKAEKKSRKPRGKKTGGALILAPKVAAGAKKEVLNEIATIGSAATAGFAHTHDAYNALANSHAKMAASAAAAGSKTGGLFSRMAAPIARVGSVIARVVGLFGTLGYVTAGLALGAVAVGVWAAAFHKAGYLIPFLKSLKTAFDGVLNAVSLSMKGIGDALALGDVGAAFEVLWLGMKVAFFRAIRAMAGDGGSMLMKFGEMVGKVAWAIFDSIWQMIKAIPNLLYAAVTGTGSLVAMLADIWAGNGATLRDMANNAESDFSAALNRLDERRKKQVIEGKADAAKPAKERKPTEQERFAANVGRGVDLRAASLPDATIADANQASQERMKSLRAEIDELRMGKAAYDDQTLALGGVTAANRRSIAALEAQKLAVEAVNGTKEKIKSVQEEIAGIRFGTDNVERYKLAQQGVDKVLLSRLSALQQEKLLLETMKGLKDQATEAMIGADAANLLRLAQQGLTRQQLASVSAMSELAKRMSDARSTADALKEKFKSPLEAYQETAAKIRDAQMAGMISQELAAKAYADAMGEMQTRTDELNAKASEGPKFVSTFEQRRDLFAGVEQQARQARAIAEGQQQAAINARDAARLALGNKNSQLSQSEQLQLGLMREQNEFLSEMNKNLAKPKVVVSIP